MADDNRIQEMQQHFNELRQAIASDIADRFEASERRLREGLSEEMADRFQASERRLRDNLSKDMAAQLEATGASVKTAAGNYGGVLTSLKGDLADFRDEWRKETADTRKVLANHGYVGSPADARPFPKQLLVESH